MKFKVGNFLVFRFYYFLPLVIVLFVLHLLFWFSLIVGYSNSIATLAKSPGIQNFSNDFYSLITINEFRFFQTIVFLWICLLHLVILRHKYTHMLLVETFTEMKMKFRTFLRALFSLPAALFTILIAVICVWAAWHTPITYDEAFTYNRFTHQGFLTTISNYPAPNNHVLFSLITIPFDSINAENKMFFLRLPAIIFTITAIVIISITARKHLGKIGTWIMLSLVTISFMTIYYGHMCRGYSLTLLAFSVGIHFAMNIVSDPRKIFNHVMLQASSLVGICVMPSYLYAILFLVIFIVVMEKTLSKELIVGSSIMAFFCLSFYTPILIISGYESITSNPFTKSIPRIETLEALPHFLHRFWQDLFGLKVPTLIPILILLIGILVGYRKKNKLIVVLSSLTLFLPPIILVLHSVQAFSRTFNYLIVPFSLILGFILISLFKNINEKVVASLSLLLAIFALIMYPGKLRRHDDPAYHTAHLLDNLRKSTKVNVYSSLLEEYVVFRSWNDKLPMENYIFHGKTEVNTDTLKVHDSVIIVDKNLDRTVYQKNSFEDTYYRVYDIPN